MHNWVDIPTRHASHTSYHECSTCKALYFGHTLPYPSALVDDFGYVAPRHQVSRRQYKHSCEEYDILRVLRA